MAEFGNPAVILGLFSAIGVIVSIVILSLFPGVASFLGSILNAVLQFFQSFLFHVWSVIKIAPRFIQVLIFLIVGVGLIGLISQWILASEVVCSEGVPYQSSSFMSVISAKILSNDDFLGKNVDEQLAALSQKRKEVFGKWGSFVVAGRNTNAIPSVPVEYADVTLVAFPQYQHTDAEFTDGVTFEENISDGFVLFDQSVALTDGFTGSNLELTLNKETSVSAWMSGREAGRCYLDGSEDMSVSTFLSRPLADQLAIVRYGVEQGSDGNWRVNVDYNIQVELGGTAPISRCPSEGVDGEILLVAGGVLSEVPFIPNVDSLATLGLNDTGWVHAKYIPWTVVNGNASDPVQSGGRRSSFIRENAGEFVLYESSDDLAVSFRCDGGGEGVETLIFGLDVFNMTTMMFLMVLVGIFFLLSKLNMI